MCYGALCSSLFIILKKHGSSSSSSLLMTNNELNLDLNFSSTEWDNSPGCSDFASHLWQKMEGSIWTSDFNGLQITELVFSDTSLSFRF